VIGFMSGPLTDPICTNRMGKAAEFAPVLYLSAGPRDLAGCLPAGDHTARVRTCSAEHGFERTKPHIRVEDTIIEASTTTVVPLGDTAGSPSGVTVATSPMVFRSISVLISDVIILPASQSVVAAHQPSG
jgi:hypothetical protein